MQPNGQHIGYCTVHCITSITQQNSLSNKIVQKLEEQVDEFFNVTSYGLVKTLSQPA